MANDVEKLIPLDWTGERYLPQIKGDIELEHMHRYVIADNYCKGKRVLDIASGEGYGSAFLARSAGAVVGVDIDSLAIDNAQIKYVAANLSFKLGSCSKIPLDDSSVDVVVSFETIEHHEEHDAMMTEIKRVLRKDGMLIISCPDKLEYSDIPNYSNPYHKKELYRHEFQDLLQKYFKKHSISGQKIVYGSGIFGNSEENHAICFDATNANYSSNFGLNRAVYFVALASDFDLPVIVNGIFEQPIHLSDHVIKLENIASTLSQTNAQLEVKLAKKCFEVELIYKSNSWRITKSLRYLSTLLRSKNG